jgi:hypothetical protein
VLLRQRVFGIACGYADGNDAARLADEPHPQVPGGPRSDRRPGPGLAADPVALRERAGVAGAAGHGPRAGRHRDIDTHRRQLKGRATRITIDLDPTDDPTHGQQEFTFFNGHYDSWCYLPVVATVTFNDEAEQFAVAAVLRPGNAPAPRGARGILRRLLGKLRTAFPTATCRLRLDGGFAHPSCSPFWSSSRWSTSWPWPATPGEAGAATDGKARMRSKATGETAHLSGETRYAARTWKRKRRVIIKPKWCGIRGGPPRTTRASW